MLIKRALFLFVLLYIFSFTVLSAPSCEVSGKSAVIINNDTMEVIYEKNAREKMSMASTTKIMTALIAIESGRLDCVVVAEKDSTVEGTAIGIKKGDSFTLRTLVYAMLLESGNDAAVLTAEYLAGSEKEFAKIMNKRAAEIGMISTNFVTASGLDAPEHYTTAYDMALLGSCAVKNPVFRQICSAKTYVAEYISPNISSTYSNHNRLLYSYEGAFGIKTGFTKKSGRCLVSACEQNGTVLVAVTLNAADDWNDHIRMYDYGYSVVSAKKVSPCVPDKIKVYSSERTHIGITLSEKFFSSEMDSLFCYRVILPDFLYAPVRRNETIGYIEILKGDRRVKKIDILADEEILVSENYKNKPEYGLIYRLKHLFS